MEQGRTTFQRKVTSKLRTLKLSVTLNMTVWKENLHMLRPGEEKPPPFWRRQPRFGMNETVKEGVLNEGR